MDQGQNKKTVEATVSVNTQMVAMGCLIGLFMLRSNRNMRVIIDNQHFLSKQNIVIGEALDALKHEAVTVKDVVQLAAKASPAA